MQVLAELCIESQKLVNPQPGHQKRNRQPGGVKDCQYQSAFPAAAGGCQSDNAAQNWANAWRPAGRESNAQRQRSQHSARLLARELAGVSVKVFDLQQSDQVQA